VSEHVLASDEDPVSLRVDFPERLIACMERPGLRWTERIGRAVYVVVPIAAAALIALAFMGFFDGRRDTEVAGARVIAPGARSIAGKPAVSPPASAHPIGFQDPALESWWGQVRTNLETKRESVESLQTAFDQTLLQPLNALEQATKHPAPAPADPEPVEEEAEIPESETDRPAEDIEDL